VTPNIKRNGRIARAITGLLTIGGGVACLVVSWPESLVVRWVLIVIGVMVGLFQLYEAKRGWCIARACGMKTPM
jgi:hypothetical protein